MVVPGRKALKQIELYMKSTRTVLIGSKCRKGEMVGGNKGHSKNTGDWLALEVL